jgi:serine/threonine protein phosphatase PrpC
MRLEISGRAIVGSKDPQQDSWRVYNARGEDLSDRAARMATTGDGTLVVLADGIGGYAGGEVASRLACDAFGATFFADEDDAVDKRLRRALEAANAAIGEEKQRRPDLQDMGCTLIGVHFARDVMTFVSVGDSLLLRSRDQEMHRVNLDHSYFEYLDRQVLGSDDPEKWSIAVHDPRKRGALTLAVTGGELRSEEYGHEVQIARRPLQADDVIIIATDGIETLDLVQLQNFMLRLRPSGAERIAEDLIRAVDGIGKTRSFQDNTTIVVVAASEGAGVTRVARPASAAAAARPPGHDLIPARMHSSLRKLSWKGFVVGAALVVFSLLALLYKVDSDSRDQPPAGNSTPKSTESSTTKGPQDVVKEPGRSAASVTPIPSSPKPENSGVPPPAGEQTQAGQGSTAEKSPDVPNNDASTTKSDQSPTAAGKPTPVVTRQIQQPRSDRAFRGPPYRFAQTSNPNQCIDACLADTLCVAFTFHAEKSGAEKRCELFASVNDAPEEKNVFSGCVEQSACRVLPPLPPPKKPAADQ